MSENKNTTPKFGDYMLALTKGGLSSIPVVGGVVSELFSVVYPTVANKFINKVSIDEASEIEIKRVQVEYGQLISRIMNEYGESLQNNIENDHLNDFSFDFGDKLELLKEGLLLMKSALSEVEHSNVFLHFSDKDREEIKFCIEVNNERLENIYNDSYYQFEEEVDEDIESVLEFYKKARNFMYQKTTV